MYVIILTLFHHANVHTTFEPACLTVAPVVLGDGATAVKGTCEVGLTLHAAPEEIEFKIIKSAKIVCEHTFNTNYLMFVRI